MAKKFEPKRGMEFIGKHGEHVEIREIHRFYKSGGICNCQVSEFEDGTLIASMHLYTFTELSKMKRCE